MSIVTVDELVVAFRQFVGPERALVNSRLEKIIKGIFLDNHPRIVKLVTEAGTISYQNDRIIVLEYVVNPDGNLTIDYAIRRDPESFEIVERVQVQQRDFNRDFRTDRYFYLAPDENAEYIRQSLPFIWEVQLAQEKAKDNAT